MIGARPLTRKQVKAAIAASTSARDKALLTLGFCTGFRISELLSVRVCDVVKNGTAFSHVTVKASNTKTKKGRTTQLNTDAQKCVLALVRELKAKGVDDNAPLFVSRKHAQGVAAITRQQAHRILKAVFASIGELGNVSAHTMRKTFAKAIYDATKKLELVQKALGHASISSTIAYLSFSSDEIDAAINSMNFL